jgi:hypothetical protein
VKYVNIHIFSHLSWLSQKTVGDGEKLLEYLNSALKVLSALGIFPHGTKKKLNFVDQCYLLNTFKEFKFVFTDRAMSSYEHLWSYKQHFFFLPYVTLAEDVRRPVTQMGY